MARPATIHLIFLLEIDPQSNIGCVMAYNSEEIYISRLTVLTEKLKATSPPNTLPDEGAIFVSDGSEGLVADSLYFRPESNGVPVNLAPSGGYVPYGDPILSVQNRLNVKKNPGMGEFLTIQAAIASIGASSGPTNRFIISIGPGIYMENPLVIPQYTYLVGMDINAVVVQPLNTAVPLMTFSENTGASFFTISGSNTAGFVAMDCPNSGDFTLFHKISIFTSNIGFRSVCTTPGNLIFIEYMDINESASQALHLRTTGAGEIDCSCEDFFILTMGIVPNIGIELDGSGIEFDTQGANLEGINSTSGTCISLVNGPKVKLQSTSICRWLTGITNPNVGPGANLVITNTSFTETGTNLNIQNTATVGYGDGYSEYEKTLITNSQFFITNKPRQIISVALTGGDYDNIADAIASIGVITPAATANYPYTIQLAPGIYPSSSTIVLPSFVEIKGITSASTRIVSSAAIAIEGSPHSALTLLTVSCPTGTCVRYRGNVSPGPFQLFNVVFGQCQQFADFNNDLGTSNVFVVLSTNTGSFQVVRGISTRNCSLTITASFFQIIGGLIDYIFDVEGASAVASIINSGIRVISGGPDGVGINISNNATIICQNCIFNGLTTAIYNPLDATAPVVRLVNMFFNDCTNNLIIDNPNTTGVLNLVSERNKVTLPTGPISIAVFIQDPTPNDAALTFDGRLFFGRAIDQITDITSSLLDTSVVGLVSGGVISNPGGLQVSVSAGSGYLIKVSAPNYYSFVSWSTLGPLTVTAQTNSYIYIDNNGNLASSNVLPDIIHNILLGSVVAVASSIILIESTPQIGNQLASRIDTQLKQSFGAVYTSGSFVVINAPDELDVSNGTYFFGSNGRFEPVGDTSITFSRIFSVGTTENVQLDTVTTNVPLATYNDITTGIVALAAGQYTAHALYVYTNNITTTYLLRYGQAQLATLSEARGYVVNSGLDSGIPIIATVIVQSGTANIIEIVDRRPFLSTTLAGYTPTITAHSALTGLTVGNDHPQYFRVDGTSPMAAAIDNGGFAIINNSTVNGVTVQAHAARHLPGGPDALTTAVPVTIGTTNSLGSAAAFARSDHVHAHGNQTSPSLHAVVTSVDNGFMSSSDKSKLDASTDRDSLKTLVERSGTGDFQIQAIQYMDQFGSRFVELRADPNTGPWVFYLPTDPGNSGDVLTTDGTGVTKWSPAGGFVDPMTTPYDMIYRNQFNITARFPIGAVGQTLRAVNTTFSTISQPPTTLQWSRTINPRIETVFFDDISGGLTSAGAFDMVWRVVTSGGSITTIATPAASYATITSVGWAQFTSGTVAGTSHSLALRSNNSMSLLGSLMEYECGFALGTLNTGTELSIIKIGFGNQTTVASPTNGFWLQVSGNPPQFFCNSITAGVLTTVAVPLAVATPTLNTWYRVYIFNTFGSGRLIFNLASRGAVTLANTTIATITTNIPNGTTTTFGPILQISNALGTANKSFLADYVYYCFNFVERGRSDYN